MLSRWLAALALLGFATHAALAHGPTRQKVVEKVTIDAPADAVVHQCGSGVTACHNLLAMEVAGLPGTALYPGSWSEWCADPARPVARG